MLSGSQDFGADFYTVFRHGWRYAVVSRRFNAPLSQTELRGHGTGGETQIW